MPTSSPSSDIVEPATSAKRQPELGKPMPASCDDVWLLEQELARQWSASESSLDEIFQHAMFPAGKLLRPRMCMEAAAAVGGDPRRVLPAAAGIEFGHVASLIHDDVIDGDAVRRGRASVAHEFGINDAIIAGDALFFATFAAVGRCADAGVPGEHIAAAMRAIADAGVDVCRGQMLEARLSRTLRFDMDAYMHIIRGKTAALFAAACQVGAILGGGKSEEIDALVAYGRELGLAFQIRDDLLPYTESEDMTGKPAASDVRNRRPTIAVLLTYEALSPQQRRHMDHIFTAETDPLDMWCQLKTLVVKSGAAEAATQIAQQHARRAQHALDALPPTASRARLSRLADFAMQRGS